MKSNVKVWLGAAHHDIRSYNTTVTLYGTVTLAVTFPGKYTRKEALVKLFYHLVAETGRWSPAFLQEVKALSIPHAR